MKSRLTSGIHFLGRLVFLSNRIKLMLVSILHGSILQIMYSPYQLSEGTKPDSIFPLLKVTNRALGQCRFARKTLREKCFFFCSDLIQIFRVHYSLVFTTSFIECT